eukprot:4218652-Pleurochrysis_carterae.AAC.1
MLHHEVEHPSRHRQARRQLLRDGIRKADRVLRERLDQDVDVGLDPHRHHAALGLGRQRHIGKLLLARRTHHQQEIALA